MFLFPSGLARTRLASLVVAATQEVASACDGVRRTRRCAEPCYRPDWRLPPRSTAVARQQRSPSSVSAGYPPPPLSRLEGALRRTIALFGSFPASVPSSARAFAFPPD